MAEYRVPVVVEVILERVTNISMGTELDNVTRVRGPGRTARGRADRGRRPAGLTMAAGLRMKIVVAPDKFKGSLPASAGGRRDRRRLRFTARRAARRRR